MLSIEQIETMLMFESQGYTNNNDELICPSCEKYMDFHGDEDGLDIGEGYWECDCCGFKRGERDVMGNYLTSYEMDELKRRAFDMGYVFHDKYGFMSEYDPDNEDDQEYAEIYG